MSRIAVIFCLCWLLSPPHAAAQQPATLATLFEDVYGPRGLVLNSDDVQLDGSTHAAHFNSAFQSDFRLVNIALTSQLTSVPLPSPASGFTYKFDPATGTFVRSTTSFGPILADRAETIGRGRLAFGFTQQFFSFDHLDGVPLTSIPAVFRHDNFQLGWRPRRRRINGEHRRGQRQPVHWSADLRNHRSSGCVAGRSRGSRATVAALQRHDQSDRHGDRGADSLLSRRPVDWRIRVVSSILRRRIGGGPRRSAAADESEPHARGNAGVRRRTGSAAAHGRRTEPAWRGRGWRSALRDLFLIDRAVRATRQSRLSVERGEPAGW